MYKVTAYTDGACRGNPGPMGAGVVLMANNKFKHFHRSLGAGTNNIAELTAISLALSAIHEDKRCDTRIIINTDSQYCIGVLSKGWKINVNATLILAIKELIKEFGRVEFEKVPAHSNDKYNEWADNLARLGVKENS